MIVNKFFVIAGAASFSTRDVWDGYRRGLANIGCDVIPYPTFSLLKVLSHESVGNDLVGKALDVRNGINVAIFVDGMYFQGERSWVPRTLRGHGVLTVLVKTEDPYTILSDCENSFDVIAGNELATLGESDLYLPTATVAPPSDLAFPDQPEFDISFVGTLFSDRLPLVRQLAQFCEAREIRFHLCGNFLVPTAEFESMRYVTVRRKTVHADAKWQLYANSRIVLNLFRESDIAVSPSPRVFEVTALGGPALLTGPPRSETVSIFGDSVYSFLTGDEMCQQLALALEDEPARVAKVEAAKSITLRSHLYDHRSQTLVSHLRLKAIQDQVVPGNGNSRTADAVKPMVWIIGCGRTGSTWLSEMLSDVAGVDSWHEPYFGRLIKHLDDEPRERTRPQSFFSDATRAILFEELRRTFYRIASQRFPGWGRKTLFIKDVNTPEFFGSIAECFPESRLIFLARDPFDVLDSYLSMNRPGSWNRSQRGEGMMMSRQSARHIHYSFDRALAAYESFPNSQKRLIRYEDMLDDPAAALIDCCQLAGVRVSKENAEAITAKHKFDGHKQTGELEFRRFGKSGIWMESGNFTQEIKTLADSTLSELRSKLSYTHG